MNFGFSTALAFLLLFLGACGNEAIPEAEPESIVESADTRPLRAVIDEDLPTLDPHHHLTIVGGMVLRNIFEPLVDLDREGEVVPRLAKRWETSDSKTWHFFLREDVRFHDGSMLTTEDVVFSLERARDHPKSKIQGFLAGVTSISHDSSQGLVTLETKRQNPFFLKDLLMALIVPSQAPEEIRQPVGTGPYRFVSYQNGFKLVMSSYSSYWRGAPREAEVEFWVIPEAEESVPLLEKGELDLLIDLPPTMVERVEAHQDLWVDSRLSQSVLFLELNPATPPFDDPKVRKAVSLAIDRHELMTEVSLNHSRPASQMVGPGIMGHDPEMEALPRNLEAARRLLRESTYGEGVEIELETTDRYLIHTQAIAMQLEEAGFETQVTARPWPSLYTELENGEVGAWFGVWNFDSSDAGTFFAQVIHSPVEGGAWGSVNFATYGEPAVDRLIRSATAELDLEARRSQFQQISREIVEMGVYVPVLWPLDLYALPRNLEWEARKDGLILFFDMHRARHER